MKCDGTNQAVRKKKKKRRQKREEIGDRGEGSFGFTRRRLQDNNSFLFIVFFWKNRARMFYPFILLN